MWQSDASRVPPQVGRSLIEPLQTLAAAGRLGHQGGAGRFDAEKTDEMRDTAGPPHLAAAPGNALAYPQFPSAMSHKNFGPIQRI
jgi:hypothetical protein